VHFADKEPSWRKWIQGVKTALLFAAIYCVADIALNRFAFSDGNPWNRVTVSIGYAAVAPGQLDQQSGLAQLADAALYQAKRLGRNRVETISSPEGLDAAKEQVGASSKVRLLRLLRQR